MIYLFLKKTNKNHLHFWKNSFPSFFLHWATISRTAHGSWTIQLCGGGARIVLATGQHSFGGNNTFLYFRQANSPKSRTNLPQPKKSSKIARLPHKTRVWRVFRPYSLLILLKMCCTRTDHLLGFPIAS